MQNLGIVSALDLLVAVVAYMAVKWLRIVKREKHLSPGPPTVPVLGNAHMDPVFDSGHFRHGPSIPNGHGNTVCSQLKKIYNTVIAVSDITVLKEFMDRRSETSGRPPQYLIYLATDGNVPRTGKLIPRSKELKVSRDAIAYMAATSVEAGTGMPSIAASRTMVLCFTAFPEALWKVQHEIDTLSPDRRPPTVDDLKSLPYVRAFVREYRGYIVLKDATVFTDICECHTASIILPHSERSRGYFARSNHFDEPERFILSEHGTKTGADDYDRRTREPESGRTPSVFLPNTFFAHNLHNASQGKVLHTGFLEQTGKTISPFFTSVPQGHNTKERS
ncbi:hypothetical protein NP233_g2491 [Leucocoprinus birnbaumii]|uniref:Cytochrome P450 n=1 Tax=Leucocoprinus birnbaumii TaxID=56174 RepID=A0AAD5YZ12_9AGAR|nr:hypothetical protein NP233_g2491 [Leucocoprinus birnbaumii]